MKPETLPSPPERSLDRIRVLHVDDEPGFADLAGSFIEREDDRIEVVTETRARDGLDRLEREPIDCIVSDYRMPVMDGLESLDAVREEHPDLPFILFTGQGSEEVASRALTAGATEYLQKDGGTDQYALLANRIHNAVEMREMRRQRERHLHAIETAHEGISILDDEGRFVYVNRTYADLYGYDPEELIGEHWELLYPDDEVEFVREEILPAVDAEGYWHGRATGLRADGTTFQEDHVVSTTGGGDLVCTVRDLTNRQRREQELDLKTRAMDEAPVGILITDYSQEDNPIVYANDRFEELTGYTESEILGRNCRFLQGEGTEEAPVAEMREAIDAREPVSVELRNYRKNGSAFWNRVTIAPVRDDDGEMTNWVGFQEDVTERKHYETTLREERKALREMDRIISDREASFEEQLRQLLDLGREYLDLPYGYVTEIGDETQTIVESRGDHAPLQSGTTCPLEETYCRRVVESGETVAVRNASVEGLDAAHARFGLDCYIGAKVVTDDDLYGTLCFSDTDDREEPFTESERTFVELLARWVGYEIENQHSRARVRDRNDRLDAFASAVSHDLRNPLRTAEGQLELAARECDSEHLEVVERAHDRMHTLIDDLLTLARQGEAIGAVDDVDVAETVEKCWQTVETGTATLDIETERVIRANESRFRQLLENLLRNAVEHGGEGVMVTVGDLDDGGIYVADDGRGIPASERDRVLESGYSTGSGTGFGLSIVEEIAEAHGWDVHPTEGTEGGARFEIRGVGSLREDDANDRFRATSSQSP